MLMYLDQITQGRIKSQITHTSPNRTVTSSNNKTTKSISTLTCLPPRYAIHQSFASLIRFAKKKRKKKKNWKTFSSTKYRRDISTIQGNSIEPKTKTEAHNFRASVIEATLFFSYFVFLSVFSSYHFPCSSIWSCSKSRMSNKERVACFSSSRTSNVISLNYKSLPNCFIMSFLVHGGSKLLFSYYNTRKNIQNS